MKTTRLKMFSIIALLSIVLSLPIFTVYAAENEDTQPLVGAYYEMKGNENYEYSEAEPVGSMSYGQPSLGQLTISGTDLSNTTYDGISAYGVTGNVSFSYIYSNALLNAADDEWHLVEDKEKKVAGQKLDANILKGVLIIQKSYDGTTYENATNPVTNFFGSNTSGIELYKSDGEDISQGIYYRFILAYQTEKKMENSFSGTSMSIEDIWKSTISMW